MIGDRWGVSDAEVAAPYPCDPVRGPGPPCGPGAGVDVAAPPERVWPWVSQLRVAPYSYDWLDNGGRRSPQQLLDLPEPRVGDPFTSTRGKPIGRLLAVDPGRSLTGEVLGAVMTYVVAPVPAARTAAAPAQGRHGDLAPGRAALVTLGGPRHGPQAAAHLARPRRGTLTSTRQAATRPRLAAGAPKGCARELAGAHGRAAQTARQAVAPVDVVSGCRAAARRALAAPRRRLVLVAQGLDPPAAALRWP